MKTRAQIQIKGIVQGVGFRPFVFALAAENSLKGRVLNNGKGVLVDVEGEDEKIARFIDSIKTRPPPLAYIESVTRKNISEKADFQNFEIIASEANGRKFVPVSPDIAVCADCLREMFDPEDRRYLYPFINCTNCGPRFTIIENIPYDRAMTTMRAFEMCAACRAEYENPLDRRFHAEPTCCPKCGPKVFFTERGHPARSHGLQKSPTVSELGENKRNERASRSGGQDARAPGRAFGRAAIKQTRQFLRAGKTVAVKGIGGFHLACDARNDAAIETLRERKGRVDKPFAVMCRDLRAAKNLVEISEIEESFLAGKERPIVLLKKRASDLSELVAPGNRLLGVMLPYAPLHYLLFGSAHERKSAKTPDVLVMTSGNFTDEPIAKGNGEALERLAALADAFLLHDREIYVQCDDSVIRVMRIDECGLMNPKTNNQKPKTHILPVRRSRGYAPFPVKLPFDAPQILAVGGELKAAFCLTREDYAFMSQHIGDMENLETLRAFERSLGQMKDLFRIEPETIACDKHPGYLSANWARKFAENSPNIKLVEIQHHRAHIAAVMAENGFERNEKAIGFAFDGTGFGDDGRIWGGEVFAGDYANLQRAARLEYFPLAGGDAAIKRPYRAALSLLREAGIDWSEDFGCVSFCPDTERKILARQLENNLNVVPTSSFGRLFDAVASLANVRQKITYEAQAAIEFEALLDESVGDFYRFGLTEGDIIEINWKNLIREIAGDVSDGVSVPVISAKFHNAAANLILDLSRKMRERFALHKVALSGGCFQNVALLRRAISLLEENDFEVFTHARVPPNDGGLALGQAVIASVIADPN